MLSKTDAVSLTVIFVCRNHSRFVLTALDSLLEQKIGNVEVLIFDVASEDDSVAKILKWREAHAPNSLFHRYEENVGIVRVVKDAVTMANGEYLRLLSTDDFFTEGSLHLQLDHLGQHGPQVAACFADAQLIDQEGTEIGFRKGINSAEGTQVFEAHQVRRKLMSGNWIAAPTVMLRKQSVADAVNQLDETIVFEDYQLWMRLSERYDFLYLPKIVVAYRQHPGSFSSNRHLASKSLDDEIQTLRRAIRATPAMGFRGLKSSKQIMVRSLALGSFRLIASACLLAFQGVWLGVVSSVARLRRERVKGP